MEIAIVKTCEQCQAEFECGAQSPDEKCWCMELPMLTKLPENTKDCLCPACLQEYLNSKKAALP